MRRISALTVFMLPALLLSISLTAPVSPVPQEPLPPDLPHQDGAFSQAYLEAHRLLQASWLPENARQKEALLLKAVERFTEAIQETPDNPSAYVGRGVTYAQLGQYDLAIADYNAALRIAPWSFEALWDRGVAYEGQGKLCEALADFEAALSRIRNTSRQRTFERAGFLDKVEALRSQLGGSEGRSRCSAPTSQNTLSEEE